MNCDNNNQKNNGCGCNCNPNPTPAPAPADISMSVCDKSINMLPMLQTYTTKVLKPNIEGCCRKNILTQQMMSCEGYKYVIKWDFDLDGKTITVPKNCILEFDGGSLKNGTIVGQNTLYINVGDTEIWGENLTREGTWREKQGGGGIPDKEYDPEHNSGLGRKTLELKGDSNVLTQEDFDQENTIYVISYDFDLNGGTIEIPEGCVLKFEGGSLSNGTIVGDYTTINAPIYEIFKSNLTIEGDFNTGVAYPEWFGAKGDGVTDDTLAIQRCIDFTEAIGGGTTKFSPKQYKLTSVTLKTRTDLDGCGQGATILISDGEGLNTDTTGIIVYPINIGLSNIENMTILGTNNAQNGIVVVPKPELGSYPLAGAYGIHENRKSIQERQAYKDATISNVYVGRCHYGILCKFEAYRILIKESNIKFCDYGIFFQTTDSSINECYIEHCNYDGLVVDASNNKISNIKSIWNGSADPINCYGIQIKANRNCVTNCEVQDNYGSGIRVTGGSHTFTNVIANSDAWIDRDDPQYAAVKEYEQVDGQGLAEWVLYTVNSCFNNCLATSYRNDRPSPKYPILYQAASQELGTDIKIFAEGLLKVAKEPIYPDFPIRTIPMFELETDHIDYTKGYRIGDKTIKLEIPINETPETINMGVVCEFIPERVISRECIYNLYKFFGLYLDPPSPGQENGLTLIFVAGNRYPNTFTVQNIDVTKPVRVSHRVTFLGKNADGSAKISSYANIWYYSTHRNGYINNFTLIPSIYNSSGVGDFRDFAENSVGFRAGVSYLHANVGGGNENIVYLRKLLATYDNYIPDSVAYPGYPLYSLKADISFDYLTLRANAGLNFAGPTTKRPMYTTNGSTFYDTTIDLPISFARNAWGNISLVPIGNVSPIVEGNSVPEGTINADNLEAGTVGIYNLGDSYKDQFNYPFKSCYVLTYSAILDSNNYKVQIATPMNLPGSVPIYDVGENRQCYRMKISGTYTPWRMFTGENVGTKTYGDTASRPNGSAIFVGYQYMDTTLGKPIYAKEINGDTVVWVDSTGTLV